MDDQSDSSVTGQARLMDNCWGKTWGHAAGYLGQLQNGVPRPAATSGVLGTSRMLCPPMAELTPT